MDTPQWTGAFTPETRGAGMHVPDPHTNLRECWLTPAHLMAIDDHVAFCEVCRKSLCALADNSNALLSVLASVTTVAPRSGHPEKFVLQALYPGRA
jgi:hypothetical protein